MWHRNDVLCNKIGKCGDWVGQCYWSESTKFHKKAYLWKGWIFRLTRATLQDSPICFCQMSWKVHFPLLIGQKVSWSFAKFSWKDNLKQQNFNRKNQAFSVSDPKIEKQTCQQHCNAQIWKGRYSFQRRTGKHGFFCYCVGQGWNWG